MKRLIGTAALAASAAMLLTSCGRTVGRADPAINDMDVNALSADAAEPVTDTVSMLLTPDSPEQRED